MYGLSDPDLEWIRHLLSQYPNVQEAIIFGSRALGSHEKGSDIDLALKGENLESTVTAVSGQLNDESPLPYFVDVINYNALTNEKLRDHIDRIGKTLYAQDAI